MKLSRIFVLLLACGLLILPSAGFAQSNSANQETTSSAELRRAIKERIEETLKDKDNANSQQFFGFIGTITQVGSTTFGLTCPRGDEKTIQIMDSTTLLSNGKPLQINELVVGNGVTVMGTQEDELVIDAQRVLMSTDNFTENRQVTLGNIAEIGKQEITIQPRGEQQQITWPTTRQTTYEDMNGQEITATEIEEDQSALVITDIDKDDKRYIKRLRLLVPVSE